MTAQFEITSDTKRVISIYNLSHALTFKGYGPDRLVIAEIERGPGLSPFRTSGPEDHFIAAPEDWEDAPEKPACLQARYECDVLPGGDEEEVIEYDLAMVEWDRKHRRPLLKALRAGGVVMPALREVA